MDEKYIRKGLMPTVGHAVEEAGETMEALSRFVTAAGIEVRRLALNMDQVRRYNPPPNPAKETDSRHAGYVARFNTNSSWELDAMSPEVIDALIDVAVRAEVDQDVWDTSMAREAKNREELKAAGARWHEVAAFLSGKAPSDEN